MKKFFIIGCPRSGTTMLQQALNRHPQIAIPPETKFFFSFLGHAHAAQRRHVERLNDDLGVRLRFPTTGVRTDAEARAFYDHMAAEYLGVARKPGVTLFGEKTPEHTGHLDRIRDLFPGAKFVVLSRDGRDVALSLSKTPWAPGGVYASFAVWLYYQRLVRRARDRADPDMWFVRYEDLVARPDEALRDVLAFLELPPEPRVSQGFGNAEGIPPRERPWKSGALRKITADRVGGFRRELTMAEIGVLERLGGRTLAAFGYPLVTDGKRPLTPGCLLRLSCDLLRFLARVPRRALAREFVARVRSELKGLWADADTAPRPVRGRAPVPG